MPGILVAWLQRLANQHVPVLMGAAARERVRLTVGVTWCQLSGCCVDPSLSSAEEKYCRTITSRSRIGHAFIIES